MVDLGPEGLRSREDAEAQLDQVAARWQGQTGGLIPPRSLPSWRLPSPTHVPHAPRSAADDGRGGHPHPAGEDARAGSLLAGTV